MVQSHVKPVRSALGLNQVELAQLLGVHPITISKWERGESKPTAYQTSLINHFRVAAQNRKVQEDLKHVLVGIGIGAALALLLSHLLKK